MAEIDDIFRQFAAAFIGAFDDAKPICFPERLNRDELNLTLESLKHVDLYLAYLHRHQNKLADDEWQITVLYGGAYVGEVIRSETNNYYRWIDYKDYIPAHPEIQTIIPDRTVATCAFLVDDKSSMLMPLNKIDRFIDEGQENSVYFFAHCYIAQAQNS